MLRAMGNVPLEQFWVHESDTCRAGASAYRFEPSFVKHQTAGALQTEMAFVRRYALGRPEPTGWSLLFRPNIGPLADYRFSEIASSAAGTWSEAEARLAVGDFTVAPADVLRPPGRPAGTQAEQNARAAIYAETFYTNFQSMGMMAAMGGGRDLKPCVPGSVPKR
jgi:hypothetical protein